jgi:hypothetical protein
MQKIRRWVLHSFLMGALSMSLAQAGGAGPNPSETPAINKAAGGETCGLTLLAPQEPDSAMIDAMRQEPAPSPAAAPAELKAKVFVAKKVITMDPMYPETQALATLGNRILALGTLDQVKARVASMPHEVITDFADDVIYPGFIESHAHAQTAGLEWMTIYLGQMKQMRPDGMMDSGAQSVKDIQGRIKVVADGKKDGEWIFG